MLMKSIVPSRAADTSTTRPRRQTRKASAATEPHSVRSMISAALMTAAPRFSDQQSLQAGIRPERARYFLVRQNLGDEGAEQAAGQHARQDAAEQRQIVGENFKHAIDAVTPPDQRGRDRDQHADHDHRPAD